MVISNELEKVNEGIGAVDGVVSAAVGVRAVDPEGVGVRRKTDIRLPKLSFKPYDGDPLKWKTFIDTFECAVDKRDDMSDVEK